MKKRYEGLLLGLTFVVAAGTLVQDYRLSTSIARERDAALAIERDFGAMEAALAGYRGAQAAYLSANVALASWTARADALAASVDDTLGRLRTSGAPLAAPQYDAAIAALSDLGVRDARARALVRSGSPFEASDVIFTESADPLDRLSAALAEARRIERADSTARLSLTTRLRAGMTAGAIVFMLAVTLLFFRRRRAGMGETTAMEAGTGTLGLSGAAAPARTQAAATSTSTSSRTARSGVPAAAAAATAGTVNLSDAADVCVDLARVIDGRDVAALLERAMGVLGARGGVLWVADANASVLRPSFASGYPEKVLAKLGALQVDADNATSIAFRSMRTQVVRAASPSARGAIAVPLVTAAGCVGVLSAEVASTSPSADTLAVARIIAAQVAAIVTPSGGATMAAQA